MHYSALPLSVVATFRLLVCILCILFFTSHMFHCCCRYIKRKWENKKILRIHIVPSHIRPYTFHRAYNRLLLSPASFFHRQQSQNGSRERGAWRTICWQISTDQPFKIREIDTCVQVQMSAHGHDYCVWWHRRPVGVRVLHFR